MATKTKTAEEQRIVDRRKIRDEHPDSWIAVEPGDEITGELVDVVDAWSDQRSSGAGGFYPLLTIRTQDGAELKVHCFGAVLYSEVMRHRPEIAETVTVSYQGTGEPKRRGQKGAELYRLRVAGRTNQAASVYDRIGPAPRPQGATVVPDVPISDEDLPTENDGADLPF